MSRRRGRLVALLMLAGVALGLLATPPGARLLQAFGATRPGVWLITRVVARLDPWLYRWTGGRILSTGRPLGPVLLLTTTGRRTGKERTTPVFYLRDGPRVVICNVLPPFERANAWTRNLRARPVARLQIGREAGTYRARAATEEEIARYWPRLVGIWPVYRTHFEQGGQRAIFVLDRAGETPAASGSTRD